MTVPIPPYVPAGIMRLVEMLATGEASCFEASARLHLARPLANAVFMALIDQGPLPTPCGKCAGSGVVQAEPCHDCRGRGMS